MLAISFGNTFSNNITRVKVVPQFYSEYQSISAMLHARIYITFLMLMFPLKIFFQWRLPIWRVCVCVISRYRLPRVFHLYCKVPTTLRRRERERGRSACKRRKSRSDRTEARGRGKQSTARACLGLTSCALKGGQRGGRWTSAIEIFSRSLGRGSWMRRVWLAPSVGPRRPGKPLGSRWILAFGIREYDGKKNNTKSKKIAKKKRKEPADPMRIIWRELLESLHVAVGAFRGLRLRRGEETGDSARGNWPGDFLRGRTRFFDRKRKRPRNGRRTRNAKCID